MAADLEFLENLILRNASCFGRGKNIKINVGSPSWDEMTLIFEVSFTVDFTTCEGNICPVQGEGKLFLEVDGHYHFNLQKVQDLEKWGFGWYGVGMCWNHPDSMAVRAFVEKLFDERTTTAA